MFMAPDSDSLLIVAKYECCCSPQFSRTLCGLHGLAPAVCSNLFFYRICYRVCCCVWMQSCSEYLVTFQRCVSGVVRLMYMLVIHITRAITRLSIEQIHQFDNTSYTQIHKCIHLLWPVIFLFVSSGVLSPVSSIACRDVRLVFCLQCWSMRYVVMVAVLRLVL